MNQLHVLDIDYLAQSLSIIRRSPAVLTRVVVRGKIKYLKKQNKKSCAYFCLSLLMEDILTLSKIIYYYQN